MRRSTARSIKQLGTDGWLGVGWPKEYGGQDRTMMEQLIFTDECSVAGVPLPVLTINTVGPTIMEFGTEEQKNEFLPKILCGRPALLDRLLRARRRHRPRLAHHPRRARRRRVRDQRPEDVDEPDRVRRLRLARRPHRPRRGQAQGHLDVPRADLVEGVQLDAGAHDERRDHQPHLLRGRAGAGERPGRAARTTAGGWSPTSSTTSGWRSCSPAERADRRSTRSAAGRRTPTLPDGSRVIDQEWVQVNLGRVHAKVEFLKLINWKIAWGVKQRGQPGRRLGHQGVRHRVRHRGLPPADGVLRRRGLRPARLTRRGASRAASSGRTAAR